MSIAGVGGVTPHAAFAAVQSAVKPESAEVAGAPDHDGDSDDHGVSAAASRSSSYSVDHLA